MDKLTELLEYRKTLDNQDGSGEYGRITARIYILRHGYARLYAWRRRNKGRIAYGALAGTAFRAAPRMKPLTERQRKARNEAVRRCYQNNPQRKFRSVIERNLHMFYCICAAGLLPKRPRPRIEALLGCTPVEFIAHIQKQLDRKGWKWSDWRKVWTMDHVVPVRRFNLPAEASACWHYTNLRPLARQHNHRGPQRKKVSAFDLVDVKSRKLPDDDDWLK